MRGKKKTREKEGGGGRARTGPKGAVDRASSKKRRPGPTSSEGKRERFRRMEDVSGRVSSEGKKNPATIRSRLGALGGELSFSSLKKPLTVSETSTSLVVR